MFNLINSIKEDSIVNVLGKQYRVLAMVRFVTETETQKWYVKIQLENHRVLVVSPFDDYIAFGFVGDPYPCDFPTPNTITYDGSVYEKSAEDYQIVKEVLFGDVLSMEGEVRFADYSFKDRMISIGIITRTSERADVYGKVISLDDVTVLSNK